MNSNDKMKNYAKRYVVATYIAFWIGILLAAGIYLLTNSDLFMKISTFVLSCIPTLVLLVMFKKLMPET